MGRGRWRRGKRERGRRPALDRIPAREREGEKARELSKVYLIEQVTGVKSKGGTVIIHQRI